MVKGNSISEIRLLEEKVSILFKEAGWDIKREDYLVVGNIRFRTDLSLYSDSKLVGAVEVKSYKNGISNENLERVKNQLLKYQGKEYLARRQPYICLKLLLRIP